MGISGVLARLQNYPQRLLSDKVVSWILPTHGEFTPLYKQACVCLLSRVAWSWHLRTLGIIATLWPVDWQTLIAPTYVYIYIFYLSIWFQVFERCLCSANTQQPLSTCRHILTSRKAPLHPAWPTFRHHCAPEIHSLSGERFRFNPFHNGSTTNDGSSLHRIRVWSHRWSILWVVRGVC